MGDPEGGLRKITGIGVLEKMELDPLVLEVDPLVLVVQVFLAQVLLDDPF